MTRSNITVNILFDSAGLYKKNFVLLFLSIALLAPSRAQSVTEIEAEYLERADVNIELYRKGDASIQFLGADGNPADGIQVQIRQTNHDFLFGNLLFPLVAYEDAEPYKMEVWKDRFTKLFNFGILPFYWNELEPEQGRPEWQRLDPIIDWALNNGITCKGHPLAWTNASYGTPHWLNGLPDDVTEALLHARIINNVAGYKGKIDVWDVVNEPVNMVNWETAMIDNENSDMARYTDQTPIENLAGWIERAFKAAYKANPQGQFIINEFNTFAIDRTRERFYQLVKELQERDTPITGIGLQAHEPREMWYSPESVWETLDYFARLGYPVHITEFIPQSSGKSVTGDWRDGVWTEEAQTEFAEQVYRLCFAHPAVASFNWWGLSDRYSWLRDGGLIDEEYRPKMVYNMLDRLINVEWKTPELLRKTDLRGEITFRGFYGTYDVMVTDARNRIFTYHIHLAKNEQNNWIFTLSR